MKISIWRRFFLLCSGTDIKTISQCPSEEINRYSILGTLPLVPAILGFFSASYAISLAFNETRYCYLFAAVWSFVIFTLDRCILSNNPKEGKGAGLAVARILLSIAFGFVITEPIVIGIFNDEVTEQLYNDENKFISTEIKPLEEKITASKLIIANIENKADILRQAAVAESDGSGGSLKKNLGPIYKLKQAVADSAKADANRIKAEELDKIKNIEKDIDNKKTEAKKKKAKGLLARIHSLNTVAKEKDDFAFCIWFLRFFFIGIELMPLVLKGYLKRKTDAYVSMSDTNSEKAIAFNKIDENNLTLLEKKAALSQMNIVLDNAIKKKRIDEVSKDLEFYFNLNTASAGNYAEAKTKIDKILEQGIERDIMIESLLKAYSSYIIKIQSIYTNSKEFDFEKEDFEEEV